MCDSVHVLVYYWLKPQSMPCISCGSEAVWLCISVLLTQATVYAMHQLWKRKCVTLNYCITVLQYYCVTVLLCYCITDSRHSHHHDYVNTYIRVYYYDYFMFRTLPMLLVCTLHVGAPPTLWLCSLRVKITIYHNIFVCFLNKITSHHTMRQL